MKLRTTILCSAAAALVVSTAGAQSAEEKAAARQLAVDGIKLADQGNCKDAIPKLERAEALFHAPTILGRLGECLVQQGRLVAGTEMLQRVEREALAPDAPPAFAEAKERAARVRAGAVGRIAKLVVKIDPPTAQGVAVTVDGENMSSALIGVDRPTDPGNREVRAQAPGFRSATQTVSLRDGQRVEALLKLEPDTSGAAPPVAPAPVTPPPAATPASQGSEPPAAADPGKKSNTMAYVLLGAGVVGLGVGGVTGFLASQKKSDLDDACPDKRCPAAAQGDLDDAKSMATISTIGFGVGAAGVVIGVVMLVSGGGSKDAQAARAAPKGFSATPWVGVASAGVQGAF